MNNRELMESMNCAPLQKKQEFAADCLEAYCQAKGIFHPSVIELLKHLRSMDDYESLASWERAGAVLSLSGRGDDLPSDLYSSMGEFMAGKFNALVCYVVEVGLCDMYGMSSALPQQFLDRVGSVLMDENVKLPGV